MSFTRLSFAQPPSPRISMPKTSSATSAFYQKPGAKGPARMSNTSSCTIKLRDQPQRAKGKEKASSRNKKEKTPPPEEESSSEEEDNTTPLTSKRARQSVTPGTKPSKKARSDSSGPPTIEPCSAAWARAMQALDANARCALLVFIDIPSYGVYICTSIGQRGHAHLAEVRQDLPRRLLHCAPRRPFNKLFECHRLRHLLSWCARRISPRVVRFPSHIRTVRTNKILFTPGTATNTMTPSKLTRTSLYFSNTSRGLATILSGFGRIQMWCRMQLISWVVFVRTYLLLTLSRSRKSRSRFAAMILVACGA